MHTTSQISGVTRLWFGGERIRRTSFLLGATGRGLLVLGSIYKDSQQPRKASSSKHEKASKYLRSLSALRHLIRVKAGRLSVFPALHRSPNGNESSSLHISANPPKTHPNSSPSPTQNMHLLALLSSLTLLTTVSSIPADFATPMEELDPRLSQVTYKISCPNPNTLCCGACNSTGSFQCQINPTVNNPCSIGACAVCLYQCKCVAT